MLLEQHLSGFSAWPIFIEPDWARRIVIFFVLRITESYKIIEEASVGRLDGDGREQGGTVRGAVKQTQTGN